MIKTGVGCYIFNQDGKVLMGLRCGKNEPDVWCPTGGHVEVGETLEQTAVRETIEEAGLEVKNISFKGFTEEIKPNRHYISFHYFAQLASNDAPQLKEPERFVKWEWVDPQKLPAPLMESVKNFSEKYGFIK